MSSSVKLSVVVLTYNHLPYLEQAVTSVLAQECDFPFEIVIGDDCSTDGTSAVVDRLAAAQPERIRVERPPENVGFHENFRRCVKSCTGSYVALLEGDDFWVDPHKLRDQVALLEQAPQCGIAFSKGYRDDEDGRTVAWDYGDDTRIVPFDEMMMRYRGMVLPTASIVARKSQLESMPVWFDDAPVLDIFLTAHLARSAGAAYLPRPTVAYRANAAGNWTGARSTHDWSAKSREAKRFLDVYARLASEYSIDPGVLKRRLSYSHWALARQAWNERDFGRFWHHLRQCDATYLAGRIRDQFGRR